MTTTEIGRFGEKLAAARCNKKVALKRVKYSNAKLLEASAAAEKAQKKLSLMIDYYDDSLKRFKEAEDDVNVGRVAPMEDTFTSLRMILKEQS